MKNIIIFTNFRKITYLLFLIAFSLILAACGKETDESNSINGGTYGMKHIEFPNNTNPLDVMLTYNSALLLDGSSIVHIGYDGNIGEKMLLSGVQSETGTFICFDMDKNDNYFTLYVQYKESGDGIESLTVCYYDSSGTLLKNTELSGPFGEKEAGFYPIDFIAEGGYYYIQTFSGIYIFDETGSLIYEFFEDRSDTYFKSLFRLKDGRVASNSWGAEGGSYFLFLRIFDPAAKDEKTYQIAIQGSSSDCIVTGGIDSDILLGDNIGLYEYELETENKKLLLNFLDHGVNVRDIIELILTSEGDIVCAFRSENWLAEKITVFRPQSMHGSTSWGSDGSASDLQQSSQGSEEDNSAQDGFEVPKEKEVITLGLLEMDALNYWLQNYIVSFNNSNKDYMIQTKTYLSGDDYEDALRVFNMEVMSGNAPDIIVCNFGMRVQNYINKGVFTDLYEMMDSDPDFNKSDYLQNVFEALEVNGKLHTIFPLFTVNTVTAKTSDVGEVPGWTIEEFLDFLESKAESNYIIDSYTKHRFVSTIITYYFINPKTGEIEFDRDTFLKILEAAEKFPSDALPDDTDYMEFCMNARNGDPLMLMEMLTGGFRTLRYSEVVYFGEDITCKGFPVPEGNGSCLSPGARFAISQNSTKKDGAWEFIKYMMDEYLDNNNIFFPIKISELEKIAEEATKNIYGDTEYEVLMESGETIKIGNNSSKDNEKVMNLIKTTKLVYPFVSEISDIIREEVQTYFNGQKTPDQVADIIENRVNLYIRESE